MKTSWNKKPKKNRLSKLEYKAKRYWFAVNFTICQDSECSNVADDNHHIFWGAHKNDFCLINLCRFHHDWAHKNIEESRRKYIPTGKQNEEDYKLSLSE